MESRSAASSVLRSALAVLAGIATLTALSFAIEAIADPLLMRLFPAALPDQASLERSLGVRMLMSAYGAVCVAAGGYVTAWVARRAPGLHALAMGLTQCALTLYAMHVFAGRAPPSMWIASAVIAAPAAWAGGLVRARGARARLAAG